MEQDVVPVKLIATGIPGLDEMFGGGMIKGSVLSLIGETGTGRTMFSFQFLHQGLLDGEKGLYISLFNPVEQLIAKFLTRYPEMNDRIDKDIFFVQLSPENLLTFSDLIGNGVAAMIMELKISRVVVNPFSMLEDLLTTPSGFRSTDLNQVYMSFRSTGATTLLNVYASSSYPLHSKYGYSEIFADVVACMFREFPEHDFMKSYRMLFVILKTRGLLVKTAKLVKYDATGLFTLYSPTKSVPETDL